MVSDNIRRKISFKKLNRFLQRFENFRCSVSWTGYFDDFIKILVDRSILKNKLSRVFHVYSFFEGKTKVCLNKEGYS